MLAIIFVYPNVFPYSFGWWNSFLTETPLFCVFRVSPYGLPPSSFLTISVMFMSLLESVTGDVLHQPKMAHVPTPGGWGGWPARWKVRLISTITRHVPPLFFSISWLWFPLCWLYSPEASGKSLRRRGAKSEKLTTVLPIVCTSLTNISGATILC